MRGSSDPAYAGPMRRVEVIDSHTEGEPTRAVLAGGPELGEGTPGELLRVFRERFDWFRSAVVNEPRGSEAMVGALVLPPVAGDAVCGVIFFNNVGFLNGCGHGTIGLAATLRHLRRIGAGSHVIETPVGPVTVELAKTGEIAIRNVVSYRHAKAVEVEIEWEGKRRRVSGDVAWGGNWFYLTEDHGREISARNIDELTAFSWLVREALMQAGVTGANGGEIDHIELFGAPSRSDCASRNFVLCPGKEYDRSPCGTGTSAKVACLAADGKLQPGERWGQESVIGSKFTAWYERDGAGVRPTITGGAWITAETTLVLDETDPFVHGIKP